MRRLFKVTVSESNGANLKVVHVVASEFAEACEGVYQYLKGLKQELSPYAAFRGPKPEMCIQGITVLAVVDVEVSVATDTDKDVSENLVADPKS